MAEEEGAVAGGKRRGASTVIVNLAACKYEIVKFCVEENGWKIVKEEDAKEWNLYWTDTSVSTERLIRIKPYQKLNHFVGMHILARKAGLARTLNRMKELFPEHYDFYPQTWVLPEDFPDFAAQFDEKRRSAKTFICKPSKGCQGRGIFLTRTLDNIDPHLQQVAQRYVHKPFLLDGFKFDLRVYVLVLSIAPLRIYLFEDGLVRLCTTKYVAPTRTNLRTSTMHLTNYAINKNSDEFVFNSDPARGDVGSKRSLQWFRWWLQHNGYNAQLVWARIGHMAIKTIIAAQPELAHNYRSVAGIGGAATARSCFEILGLDVLLDAKLRPWLLEVNHSPSFTCDSPLDWNIKHALISEAMSLLGLRGSDRRRFAQQQAAVSRSRLYAPRSAGTEESDEGSDTEDAEGAGTPASGGGGAGSSESSSSSSSGRVPVELGADGKPLVAAVVARRQARLERTALKNFRRIFPPYGTERGDALDLSDASVDLDLVSTRAGQRALRLPPGAYFPTPSMLASLATTSAYADIAARSPGRAGMRAEADLSDEEDDEDEAGDEEGDHGGGGRGGVGDTALRLSDPTPSPPPGASSPPSSPARASGGGGKGGIRRITAAPPPPLSSTSSASSSPSASPSAFSSSPSAAAAPSGPPEGSSVDLARLWPLQGPDFRVYLLPVTEMYKRFTTAAEEQFEASNGFPSHGPGRLTKGVTDKIATASTVASAALALSAKHKGALGAPRAASEDGRRAGGPALPRTSSERKPTGARFWGGPVPLGAGSSGSSGGGGGGGGGGGATSSSSSSPAQSSSAAVEDSGPPRVPRGLLRASSERRGGGLALSERGVLAGAPGVAILRSRGSAVGSGAIGSGAAAAVSDRESLESGVEFASSASGRRAVSVSRVPAPPGSARDASSLALGRFPPRSTPIGSAAEAVVSAPPSFGAGLVSPIRTGAEGGFARPAATKASLATPPPYVTAGGGLGLGLEVIGLQRAPPSARDAGGPSSARGARRG